MAASSSTDNWSAERYSTNASFVYSAAFTNKAIALLNPKPGEHILDLGCGSGELTLESVLPPVLPGGSVVGLDASPDLLARAEANAAALSSSAAGAISWILRDGHELDGLEQDGRYDAVFTNAALHWMKRDPAKVVRGVHGLLKSGGRFVGEFGGALNMVGVRSTLHVVLGERSIDASKIDPWFFPTPEVYGAMLEKEGFKVEVCELVPRPTALPTGLRGWLETFAFAFLDALPSFADREAVIDEVCRRLEVDMKHDVGEGEGKWTVMYVRLRFKAWKK
ncbi:hypothetical protein JCM8208_000235 [Rhodotorula glutinis]